MAFNGGKLPPKGRWYQAASEIGVTPEAFYRELAASCRVVPLYCVLLPMLCNLRGGNCFFCAQQKDLI
jgi:hypothetical protein